MLDELNPQWSKHTPLHHFPLYLGPSEVPHAQTLGMPPVFSTKTKPKNRTTLLDTDAQLLLEEYALKEAV